jgi:GAF domain-containing protein/CheY-like chemotaxis protein
VLVVAWDGEAADFTVLRAAGRFSREYVAAGRIAVGVGPVARAVKESRTVTTPNILTDADVWLPPARRREIELEGFRAVAAAPLAVKGHVHGALVVHYWRERTFDDDDVAALTRLASQAAVAIDNARVYGEASRRAARLHELAEVERLVTGSVDLDDVLRRIASATARLLAAPIVQVWVMNRERRIFERRATCITAAVAEEVLPTALAATDPLATALTVEHASVFLDDVAKDPRGASMTWATGFGLPALFAAPTEHADEVLGALTIHGATGFDLGDEDRALVTALAARIGRAIESARAYRGAVHRAERLGQLVAVTQSISASLEPSSVMQAIADAAAALNPGAFAIVHGYDRERGILRSLAVSGEDARQLPTEVPIDRGLPGMVVELRHAVLVYDPRTHPRTLMREWWAAHPGATFFGLPIQNDDVMLGVLGCIVPDRAPSLEEQELLQLLTVQAAVAIENARLYRESTRRRDTAEALARLGRELTETLDADRIEQVVTRGMVDLLRVRGGIVFHCAPADGSLTAATTYGVDAEAVRGRVLIAGEGVVGRAVQEKRLLVSSDVIEDASITLSSSLRARAASERFRAIMAAPLFTRNRILGALVVGDEPGREFSVEEQQVFQAFAHQAALALENALLYSASDRERREAGALAGAARQLAGSLDLEELAPQLVEVLRDLFNAHAAALYRLRDDGDFVSVAYGGAAREHMRPGEVLDRGAGVIARAVAERRAVWTRDALNDPTVYFPEKFRETVSASGIRAVLSVPLIAKDEVIGALVVSSHEPRDFDEREASLLQAFADQAALALDNARLYASARDSLTRLRDTQAQLVQAAKMSALGQLVSGVAHELNNPLSVVIGYGQLLLGRELPQHLRRPVELMVSQGDRMAKIVRGLLFFARQRPPERVPVQVNQAVDDTLAMRINQLSLSGIVVERCFTDDLPSIAADAQQLQQVLLNLFLNAEQAILETKRAGRIVVRTSLVDAQRAVRIEVVDDGPGIAADALPHVFEPFFTTKEVGNGTGLGLSVSYGIVQEHGGRLSVESRPGETIFTVELPIGTPVADAPAAPAPFERAASANGRIALVVEDEPSVSDFIVTLLQEAGWRVDVTTGGRGGLARVRARRYDLIVSDMRMPDGNGEELYRRAIDVDPSLVRRFIFVTGDTANPNAWEFLQEVGVPVLEKPFTPALFLETVRRVSASLTASASSA